jgi:hypothetical protein
MTSIEWGLISAGCITTGTLLGLRIGAALPKDHVSSDSKDTLKIASGMIATLVALVLGLLVASAKNSFDTVNAESVASGSKLIYLDHVLARYGPETKPARDQLRMSLAAGIERMWPEERSHTISGADALEGNGSGMEHLQDFLDTLTPATDAQRQMLAQARQVGSDLQQSRWLAVEQQQMTLPTTFLVVLLCWLTMLFICIGLFAPRNITVCFALLFCAVSFSTAIFLIVELSRPLDGLMKISSAPMRKVLEHISK